MLRFLLRLAVVMFLAAAGTWFVRFKLLAPAEPAQPQLLDEEQTRQVLPTTDLFAVGGLTRASFLPFGDPVFGFAMMVPQNWKQQISDATRAERREATRKPILMAELSPPGRADVLLEVRYVRPPVPLTLEHFLDLFASQAGFRILARQHGEFNKREVMDALLQKLGSEEETYLTRLTVSRQGEYLFLVAGSATKGEYPKWKRTFGAAAVSFAPTGK